MQSAKPRTPESEPDRTDKPLTGAACPSAVIGEARTWIGTPYHHQARLKGVGVDCAGLIIGTGLALGIMPKFSDAAWRPFAGYSRLPNPRHMRAAMESFLAPISETEWGLGDVAWMGWESAVPMHLAIIAADARSRLTMIHATGQVGRVVEHGFDAPWTTRVHSWWRYPGQN